MQIHFKIELLIQTNLHIVQILYFSICIVQFKIFFVLCKAEIFKDLLYVCIYLDKKMPCEHMWQTGKSSFPIVFSFGDSMFLNYALIILGGYYYPMGTKNFIFPHSACSSVCMKNLKRVICKS